MNGYSEEQYRQALTRAAQSIRGISGELLDSAAYLEDWRVSLKGSLKGLIMANRRGCGLEAAAEKLMQLLDEGVFSKQSIADIDELAAIAAEDMERLERELACGGEDKADIACASLAYLREM